MKYGPVENVETRFAGARMLKFLDKLTKDMPDKLK